MIITELRSTEKEPAQGFISSCMSTQFTGNAASHNPQEDQRNPLLGHSS